MSNKQSTKEVVCNPKPIRFAKSHIIRVNLKGDKITAIGLELRKIYSIRN